MLGKDPLIIECGPMTQSRAKGIINAIGFLVQATVDETSISANERTSFMLDSSQKTSWFNAILKGEGARGYHYATTEWFEACGLLCRRVQH